MKNTVDTAASPVDVKDAEAVLPWVNKEARPLLAQLRDVANTQYRAAITYSTAATGTPTTVWTSDDMPTDSVWLVEVRALAWKASTASERCAYIRRATFYSSGGTVGQQGATSPEYTEESAAACDVTLSVSGSAVICQVQDDAVNAMNWLVVVDITRSVLP